MFDAATKSFLHQVILGEDQQLEWFRWAGNDRLLISISGKTMHFGEEARISRLLSYELSTNTTSKVGWNARGLVGDDVLFIDPLGRYVLLAIQVSVYDWPSIYRYDLTSGKPDKGTRVQGPRTGIWDWYADNAGVVRMGLEPIGTRRVKIWYRSAADAPLKVVAKFGEEDFEDKIWDFLRLTSGSDEGYVLEDVDGRVALRRFNYATRTSGETVYSNPDWDLTAATISDNGEPIAAFFTDDKDRVVWFDEGMKSIQARLEKAMPDKDISVISRSKDDSRMLVAIGNEADPGALYIFTSESRTLEYFAEYRPQLLGQPLVKPSPVRYAARDGTVIHGYLALPSLRPAKALPLVILPHGGPFGVRDTLDYNDEVQFLANRGYAVLQPNYRGSGGYGDAFEALGKGQIGRAMQDDIDDARAWLVKEGIADPARVCVVGSSYGGYAALWAVLRNPELYRCAASFAGVTDWDRQLRYDTKFLSKKTRRKQQAWTHGAETGFDFASVSPARQVALLKRPVLLAHGDEDSNVPFSQFKDMRDAAAKSGVPLELIVFEGEGHGFAKSENEQRWYDTLGAFLQRNNPAD